ncbi:RING-type domain-containing protein [Mycena venus]|uniref:RING-type domain-containing protein n=1 Tax=Mycena venus TaxID=2733690 RepID=A0A8H6YZL6_9AGAR|nr:RING-type domain-containing protein [Mycena venus]
MSTFEWTTPTRRKASRALSPIPHEVYLEIYKYFEPSEAANLADCRRHLSNLALVCRFFCAVSISRIYRSLEFSGRDTSTADGHFCQLLLKSTVDSNVQYHGPDVKFAVDIAQFVKECRFKDWVAGSEKITQWSEAFLERNARAVRLMRNIESLHIESTPITKSLITTVSKLNKTLTTLCIRSCTLEGELTKTQLVGLDSLRLRVVEFFGASSVSRSLAPSTLRLRDVESFRTDSWPFGHFFVKRQHPVLRVLELHNVEDLPALFKFLEKCPSITELTIAGIVLKLGAGPMPSLAPNALPNVHTIHIPASFLPFFSGRPLRKVILAGVEARDWGGNDILHHPTLPLLTVKEITPLLQSTASITELHIPQHVYFAFPIFKHLRHLEVLVLTYEHRNFSIEQAITSNELFRAAINALCTKWPLSPSHPPLRELHLDFGTSAAADTRPFMLDLQLQLEMLSAAPCAPALGTTFPRLTSASMARFVKWQRWDEYAEWSAFVPHRFRDFVRDALARGRPFTDVDDCLGPLDYK